MHLIAIPVLLLLIVAALLPRAAPAGAQAVCRPANPSGEISLRVESRPNNALLATASVELPAPSAVYLEYGSPEAGWLRTPTTGIGSRHDLSLVRLRPGAAYEVRAFALDEVGCASAFATAPLRTGTLPAEFRRVAIESAGELGAPVTLMDLRLTNDDQRWLVALDRASRPVWYYQIPPEILLSAPGQGANSLVRLANGNLLYLARNWGLEEVDPLRAEPVRRVPLEGTEIHHDLYELPDGRILFLGAETRLVDDSPTGGPRDLPLRGDSLNLLDLDSGRYERVWSIFDTHDLADRSALWRARKDDRLEGWSHANSIWRGASGNILLSLRFLDQVISLSPDYRTVEWRLGGPKSSFRFDEPSTRFYAQHAVTEVGTNRLLMFDNGNFRPEGEFSRALELELDFGTMMARKVWEYRHRPGVFSYSQSSAYRLPNGNTLVNFGFRDEPDEPVLLVEARPDGAAASVVELGVRGQRTTRYRAYPLSSLAGETSVEPTPIAASPESSSA